MTPIFFVVMVITLGIAIFLVAQILYNLHRQKSAERLLSAFEQAAVEFGVTITKRQVADHWIIGFDPDVNKLLYMQESATGHDGYLINLGEIESCTVVKTYKPFWHGNTRSGILVEKIALQFVYKNDSPQLQLPFYQMSTDPIYNLGDREQQAKEWESFITARLEKKPGGSKKQQKPIELPLPLIDQFIAAGQEA